MLRRTAALSWQKFILLWVVSSPTGCDIDFSQWINYQWQFQSSLQWAEGKMMFLFQGGLLTIVPGLPLGPKVNEVRRPMS